MTPPRRIPRTASDFLRAPTSSLDDNGSSREA
jgi:hypothetical protein